MGNDQSTVLDEERKMLESLYQISEGRLDSGDHASLNSKVNSGTAAPNCQPSHTLREIEEEQRQRRLREEEEAERLAGLLDIDDSQHAEYLAEHNRREGRERLDSQGSLRQSQQQQPEKGSIGSYVQMAKTGYQELGMQLFANDVSYFLLLNHILCRTNSKRHHPSTPSPIQRRTFRTARLQFPRQTLHPHRLHPPNQTGPIPPMLALGTGRTRGRPHPRGNLHARQCLG